VWRLLILLIPLPLGMDRELVQKLQQISSFRAGQILDALQVPHLMSGNVLELATRRFFVAEACSGISSIYLLAAATATYVVVTEMRLVRAIPLLMSVFWWSIVLNCTRIVLIAAVYFYYGWDLSTGWEHETLGIVLMLAALLGVVSTRALLDLLLAPIGNAHSRQNATSTSLTPITLWNIVTTPDRSWVYSRNRFRFSAELSQNKLLNGLTFILLVSGATYWGTLAKATYAGTEPAKVESNGEASLAGAMEPFAVLEKTTLMAVESTVVSDFQKTTAQSTGQEIAPLNTGTWTARTPLGPSTIMVDGPYDGLPEPVTSIQERGWKLESTAAYRVPGYLSGQELVTVQVLDESGHRYHSHVCFFRQSGELLPTSSPQAASNMLQPLSQQLDNALRQDARTHVWRLQFTVEVFGLSTDSELQAEHRLFAQLLHSLQRHWRKHGRGVRFETELGTETQKAASVDRSAANEAPTPDLTIEGQHGVEGQP